MSLIYAEGFEHADGSAATSLGDCPGGGRPYQKFQISNFTRRVFSWTSDLMNSSIGSGPIAPIISSGMISENVEVGRKGGKSLLCPPVSGNYVSLSWRHPHNMLVLAPFRKSRSVFIGFAFRVQTSSSDIGIVVRFGRSFSRTHPVPDDFVDRGAKWIGGCVLLDRGHYFDIEWRFEGQAIHYGQLFHNRNIRNGDWHYIEVGTTVYGNAATAHESTAFGEVRLGGASSVSDNIRTATPGSENESYINSACISCYPFDASSTISVAFDDIYVCNDEGSVNNGFLGGIFVRPAWPAHTGALMESYSVGESYRHDAVGPRFMGDETQLPNPLPTPEDNPNFTPWDDPRKSHIIIPNEGGRQNFNYSSVDFKGSTPRVHGVVLDVAAQLPDMKIARAALTPIKSIGGMAHTYFDHTSDMVSQTARLFQLVMENPKANDEQMVANDPDWSPVAVNNSSFGFRVDPIAFQADFEGHWNPALLRYPVFHELLIDDAISCVATPSRHWEEMLTADFDLDVFSRWDWACPAYDSMTFFDETPLPTRIVPLGTWSNVRLEASLVMPEEYIRDFLDFDGLVRFDAVVFVDEQFGTLVFAYHEWVEELRVWLDPYDSAQRDWGVSALDDFGVEVSDIFDGHFDVEEELDIAHFARSNHELVEEYAGFGCWTQQGIIVYAEDDFDIAADHHDGNWVEQFPEQISINSDILTRHWRFEFFWFVCVGWWEIGVVEQPLDHLMGERSPCDVKNDNMIDSYKEFFGTDGYYDEVYKELRDQWIALGGDPNMDFNDARWAYFDTFVFDGMGNVVDMLDVNGNSIFEVM